MQTVTLARRRATVLWKGDVAVLGGGLAGLTAAAATAAKGKKTCLIEAGPTLGTEVSRGWGLDLPPGAVTRRVLELCAERGAAEGARFDVFTATLAFDRFAGEQGFACIVCAQPVRPLTGAAGALKGVEVVGKSGRQAVLARAVVDATAGRAFSRCALGQGLRPIAAATRRFHVYGAAPEAAAGDLPLPAPLAAAGARASFRPAYWPKESILSLTLPAAAGASRGDLLLATLEAGCALVTHLRATVPAFQQAALVDVAPDIEPVYAPDAAPPAAPGATGLVALPMAASLADEVSAAGAIASSLGRRARRVPLSVAAPAADAETLRASELTADAAQDLAPVMLPAAPAVRHESRDVIVAGYGAAGPFAALAASDQGASVAVLDPAPYPGGIATAGRIHSYYYGLPGGLQDRVDADTAAAGAALAPKTGGYHPVGRARVLLADLQRAAVRLLPGHRVFGAVKRGRRVEAVISADESGYHVFPCRVAVDATGDADLAVAAGAAFTLGREGDGFPQPCSYTPSRIRDDKIGHHNFDCGWVDPTDTLDFSRAHFEGRRVLWTTPAPTAAAHYSTLAALFGLRESRFIRGPATMTFDDFLEGRSYSDAVMASHAHHDNHAVDYAEESEWSRRHVVMFGLWRYVCAGEIPYRCLYPSGVNGVLVAGRALSVDHDLHQLIRMQRDMQKMGEVCGVAAALAARQGVAPSRLDARALREALAPRGVLPQASPAAAFDLGPDDLLKALGGESNGLAMWRLSRLPAGRQPDWTAFFRAETDLNRRFGGAVALALGRGPREEARPVLVQAVRERWKEPALGIKSPARFIVAALALAEMKAPEAAELLAGILAAERLDTPALLLALRAFAVLGDRRGVGAIRDFLRRTEQDEFRFSMWGCGPDVTASFRFAVVIRAVRSLAALGDRSELGRLEPYLRHERLLIRKLARRAAAEAEAR